MSTAHECVEQAHVGEQAPGGARQRLADAPGRRCIGFEQEHAAERRQVEGRNGPSRSSANDDGIELQAYLTPSLSDSKPIWLQAYLAPSLSDLDRQSVREAA